MFTRRPKRTINSYIVKVIGAIFVASFGFLLIHNQGVEEPKPPTSFTAAKPLAKRIFSDHQKTFYCGCRYDKHNKIDIASCGYLIQQDKRRAGRLEWEHIVPASLWGQSLPCWRKAICCKENRECYKGRRCCREIDQQFAKMEADLHNLVPEIGELNALRSNYRFGLLPHMESGQFGVCKMKIDPETRRVEPPSEVRGIIARAYLYMSETYGIHLSDNQQQLMQAWHKEYPPDNWEIEWDTRVANIQGNHNRYITQRDERK